MNKTIVLCATMACIILACTKSPNSPGGTTTINPPPDTSSLRKTLTYYNLDNSGNIKDSTVETWSYDNQGRQIKLIEGAYLSSNYDSIVTSFSANLYVTDLFFYDGTALLASGHNVTYLNSYGKPDSVVSVKTIGIQVAKYFYDASQNDTLIQIFLRDGNTVTLNSEQRNYFTGTSLDAEIQTDSNGKPMYRSRWLNGNLMADSTYNSGNLYSVHGYTYDNTTHPGWNNLERSNNLVTSYSQTFFSPLTVDPVQTRTYTFDTANRVATMTLTRTGAVYAKAVYTYY